VPCENPIDAVGRTTAPPSFNSQSIDGYPDDDVSDWYPQSTSDNGLSSAFGFATIESLPPLPPSTITTTYAAQSDISSSISSSPSSSLSSRSNSSFYNGIVHLFDQSRVNGDELNKQLPLANGDEPFSVGESTTPENHSLTSQYFSFSEEDDDDDIIIGGQRQRVEMSASWHSCASGSMTSAFQTSDASTDDSKILRI